MWLVMTWQELYFSYGTLKVPTLPLTVLWVLFSGLLEVKPKLHRSFFRVTSPIVNIPWPGLYVSMTGRVAASWSTWQFQQQWRWWKPGRWHCDQWVSCGGTRCRGELSGLKLQGMRSMKKRNCCTVLSLQRAFIQSQIWNETMVNHFHHFMRLFPEPFPAITQGNDIRFCLRFPKEELLQFNNSLEMEMLSNLKWHILLESERLGGREKSWEGLL